jgi:hypothetical protein
LLTRNPTKDFYPERPSGVKDLSSNPKIANSGPTPDRQGILSRGAS